VGAPRSWLANKFLIPMGLSLNPNLCPKSQNLLPHVKFVRLTSLFPSKLRMFPKRPLTFRISDNKLAYLCHLCNKSYITTNLKYVSVCMVSILLKFNMFLIQFIIKVPYLTLKASCPITILSKISLLTVLRATLQTSERLR
jgi:hypothetical protein